MKTAAAAVFLAFAAVSSAGPAAKPHRLTRREVPQEHSHEIFLDITREFLLLDNPLEIQDPIFGLLGNAAAQAGAGQVTNLDCLKQATADQAFTNAKAAGDVRGMAGALVYQALERNTGGVGVASVICPETPVNPEVAALSQHQDPASENAAEINKGITLELSKQLSLIGVDPLVALESGTFAPGDISDATGKGNSCDDTPETPGCIYRLRTLVLDATPDEILDTVADITPTFTGTGVISATNIDFDGLEVADGGEVAAAGVDEASSNVVAASSAAGTTSKSSKKHAAATPAPAATSPSATSCTTITTTMTPVADSTTTITRSSDDAAATAATGSNIQTFTGTLGGAAPPVISQADSDRPFTVGGDTFVGQNAALSRSCDIQHNQCSNAVNNGEISVGQGQCETQLTSCKAANQLRRRRAVTMTMMKCD